MPNCTNWIIWAVYCSPFFWPDSSNAHRLKTNGMSLPDKTLFCTTACLTSWMQNKGEHQCIVSFCKTLRGCFSSHTHPASKKERKKETQVVVQQEKIISCKNVWYLFFPPKRWKNWHSMNLHALHDTQYFMAYIQAKYHDFFYCDNEGA